MTSRSSKSSTLSSSSSRSSVQKHSSIDERAPLLPSTDHAIPRSSEADEAALSPSTSPSKDDTAPKVSNRKIISILAVLLIGVFLSNTDLSIVLATHALIASEFNDLSNSSWIFVSFGLAATASQPLIGKLSDIYGRKSILLIAYALFTIGCGIVGIAPSLGIVVLGRVLSGIGCAGMTALVSIIITDLVPLRDVASWRSYVNILGTAGRCIGGPVGGWFADTIGWRWTFLVQVPIMVIGSCLAWLLVPANISRTATSESPNSQDKRAFSRLDISGSILLTTTTLLLMFPLELGGQKIPWSHPLIFVLLGAGIITGFLFVKVERRAVEPVFPLELFKERDFMISFMVMAMQLAAQGSMMFTVPLYFQVTSAVSATKAGAHLLPAVLGNTVSQLISGWSIGKFGRYKIQITLGTAFTSICYMLMLLRWNGHTNFWESLYIIPGGFGTGVAASALFIAMTASVAPSMVAIAASSMYLSATVGSLVGLAVSAAILQTLVHHGLQVAVGPDVENRDEIIRRCLQDIEYVQGLEGSLKDSVIRMYLKGFDGVYIMALVLSISGTLLGLFIMERSLS